MKKIFLIGFILFFNFFQFQLLGQTTVYLENFESTLSVTPGGTPTWSTVSTLQVSGTYSYRNQIALNDSSWFITNPINLTGYSYVILEFWHICKIEFFDAAEIFISTNNGATWTKLTTEYINLNNSTFTSSGYKFTANAYPTLWLPANHSAQPTNAWWMKEQFNVSNIAANQSNVRFRFRMRDANGNGANANAGWFIDDIRVFAAAHELEPPQITLLTPILQDTITNPGAYTIRATITDQTGINNAFFCYNINSSGWDSIPMTLESGTTYVVQFPGVGFNKHVDYYVSAFDATPTQNYGRTTLRWFYTKKVQTAQIGNGTSTNTTTGAPTPYGTYYKSRRQQYLILASELLAAGLEPGTQINSIAFNVQNVNNCSPMPNYTIRVKHTTASSLTTTFDNTGYTIVWTHPNFLPVNGWNTHNFSTPFTWNGTSNLLIDLCSDLIPGSYTQNASVFFHTTSFNSAAHAQSDVNQMCLTTSSATTSTNRANIRFGILTTSFQRDISISEVIQPSGIVDITSSTPVIVRLKNNGTDTIISANITASINGNPQPPYTYAGLLIPDVASVPLNIGSFNFVQGTNILKVWSSNPNGQTDQKPSNDTITVSVFGCPGFLSGTYSINSSWPASATNFTSIQEAISALNNCGVIGPVVFQLYDSVYNTEIVLGEINGASATNTITFRPAPNTNVLITSSSTTATIRLNATKHLIFDGFGDTSGLRRLTIRNTSTASNTAAIWLSSTGTTIQNACQNITIKNCVIQAGSSTSTTFGIYMAGTTISSTGAGNHHNNISIENNHVSKAYIGIYANGTSPNFFNNITIRSNEIGSTSSSDYITFRGIHLQNSTQSLITRNYIHNIRTNASINNAGIHIDANVTNLQISKNRIHTIYSTSTSGYGAYGINIGSSTGVNNILISNNFISDIVTIRYSATSTTFNPFGIRVTGGSNIKIYNNSINLYGEPTIGSSASMSACLIITAAVSNLDVRNNIFANSMTGLAGSKSYCVYKVTAATFANSNNNNYFPSGPFGIVGYSGAADIATLSGWQSVTGQDQNSVSINPSFVSSNDLHTFNILLNGIAQSLLTDVPDDIDDEPRNPTNPDIGADEFEPFQYDIQLVSILHPTQAPCNLSSNEFIRFVVRNLGTQTITTFNSTFIINNQAPQIQSFNTNILSLAYDTIVFTLPANFSNAGNYLLTLYVSLTGDPNQLNDTLRLNIRHSHNFYAQHYTMSFEANEPYQDLTVHNEDNSQFRWEVPFVNATFARTGTNSARFFNGAGNTGQDWLFTRCFDLEANKTYRITFWYRTTSTSIASSMQFYVGTQNHPTAMNNMLLNLTNLINTTYQQATVTFVPTTSGIYYFGWRATSPAQAVHILIDDINIELLPDYEVAILSILDPVSSGCNLTTSPVRFIARNNGQQTLTSLHASYRRMDQPTIVTETLSVNLAPGQQQTLTFDTPIDLSASVSTTYMLKVWVSVPGDPLQFNDTLSKTIENIISPYFTFIKDDTIQYGHTANLIAVSTGNTFWARDSLANQIIHIGNNLTVGPLFADTTFWVFAAHGSSATAQLGTGTSTSTSTGITPFSSNYEGVRIQYLIRATELQALGILPGQFNSIAFNVTSSGAGTYPQQGYTIKMAHTTASEFSGAYLTPSDNWTTVYFNTAEPAPPVGWKTFNFSTPFNWNGTSNVLIDICHDNDPNNTCSGCYSSNSGVQVSTTTFNSVYGRYNDNAPACNANPSVVISTFNERPNMRISYNSIQCPSDTIPVSAIVIPPEVELQMLSIVEPSDKECSVDEFPVTIKFINKGSQPAVNINVSYKAITTVTETISNPVNPFDTIIYNFNTPFSIPTDTQLHIRAFVSHPLDPHKVNDTIQKQVSLGITPAPPTVVNDTVSYSQQAILIAHSLANNFWFTDSLLTTLIYVGDTFVTPPLFSSATYWVYAANIQPPNFYQLGTATTTTSTTGITPFSSLYEGARIQYIIRASELINLGLTYGEITSLAFNVTASGPGTFPQSNYTIKLANTSVNQFSGSFINPSTWQTVYFNSAEPAPPVGWKTFNFSQPFSWDGISNIVIDICHDNDPNGTCPSCYSSNSTVQYSVTPFNSVYGRYNDNAPACNVNPSSAITTFNNRPNMRIGFRPYGCPSDAVPVNATVLPPPVELKLISVIQPASTECSNNANEVKIQFVNIGSDTAYQPIAYYSINNFLPIVDTLAIAIAPYDTIIHTFSTPISLYLTTGDSIINIKTWLWHPNDPYQANDTLIKTSRFFFIPPAPTVQNVTIPYGTQANLNAVSPYNVFWYNSPTAQNPIHTGNNYVTPILYASTPYYVSAKEGITSYLGPSSNAIGAGGYVNFDTYRLFFDVLAPQGVKIESVDIYPQTAGQSFTIQVLNSTNQVIASYNGVTSVAQPNAQTVPINFTISQGNNYAIKFASTMPNIFRNTAGATFPYVLPGVIQITGHNFAGYPQYYYYFYNWAISTGSPCESERAEVWAIIDPSTIPDYDAGIVSIDSPADTIDYQTYDITVTLRNYGQQPLTSVTINWEIDNVPQTPYSWTGNLLTGQIESNILLGYFSFPFGNNTIKAWTSGPNGQVDYTPQNDTAYKSVFAVEPLCGIYTIGGSNPDFVSFTEAINTLNNWGISCPVTFIVNDGTYSEQITIGPIQGTNDTTTITFVGNSTSAILSYSSSSSTSRHTLLLNGARNIRFENLTIESDPLATYGWAVHLMNNCADIVFRSCIIKVNHTTSTTSNHIPFLANGSNSSALTTGNAVNKLLLENNQIIGGYYGILIYGPTSPRLQNIQLVGNYVQSQYYYGIYLYNLDKPIITKNTVVGRTSGSTTTSSYGIYLYNLQPPYHLTKNIIRNWGLYGVYISAASTLTSSVPTLIANNMIGGGFTSTSSSATALYITTSSNLNVYYNSINMDGQAGRGVQFLSSVTQVDYRNNSIAFTGGGNGYAEYSTTPANFTQRNFNNYFSNGTNFVYYGTNRPNLASLQSANQPVGNDANSKSGNPLYASAVDLHATGLQLYASGVPLSTVSDDIDGEQRNTLTPCIGADEYVPASVDLAVVGLVSPTSGCGLSVDEIVTVVISNLGLDTIYNFTVSYSINGGAIVTETVNTTLPTGTTMNYSFLQTANLSAPGNYNFTITVQATGDSNANNNILNSVVKNAHDFYASNYIMGFEANQDYSRWTVIDVDGNGNTWQPGYVGYANSGSRSARFYNSSTNTGGDYLFTECFYLEGGMTYKVDFWYRAESVSYPQNINVVVATEVNPLQLLPGGTLLQLQNFNNTTYQLASCIFTPSTTGKYYIGWYAYSQPSIWYAFIDDINIRILPTFDVAAIDITSIPSYINALTQDTVKVKVKNLGSATLTSFPISYSVNNGPWVTETWTGSLASDQETTYTFNNLFIVPQGQYQVCVRTELSNDFFPQNDQVCVQKFGIPTFAVPYEDDFESDIYWYAPDQQTQWQLGIPNASVINSAHSAQNVWTTNLLGNYNNNVTYYLYTPKFDFSQATNMSLGFWHWYNTEQNADGCRIEYSPNNGLTWFTLGTYNDPSAVNWYNTQNIGGKPAFSGNSNGWVYSEIPLSLFNNFQNPVQFRFLFISNASVNYNGWAIDDFRIYQPQLSFDAGVVEIIAPVGQSITAAPNIVAIRIKNFGTQTITSIPVRYQTLTGAPPVQENWSGSLAPGDTTTYTFNQPFIGPFISSFQLCAWTALGGDVYMFNDSTCIQLQQGPANVDGGVIEILQPIPPLVVGQPYSLRIRIRNFGLQPITNFPVQYFVDGIIHSTEIVQATIQPNQTMDYTFFTQFHAPNSTNTNICARTVISGDAITTNNEICSSLLVGISEFLTIQEFLLFQNIPNPTDNITYIPFYIPSAGVCSITITNVIGQPVYTETRSFDSGMNVIEFHTKQLRAGMYYYSVTFEQTTLTRKMIIQ